MAAQATMRRCLFGILVFLMTLWAPIASGTVLVQEGFEEGAFDGSPAKYCCDVQYSPWPIGPGDCSTCSNRIEFTGLVRKSGRYSLECVFNEARAAGVKIIPSEYGMQSFGADVYARIYFRYDSSFRFYSRTKFLVWHVSGPHVYVNINGTGPRGYGHGMCINGTPHGDIMVAWEPRDPDWFPVSVKMEERGENPGDWVVTAGDDWWMLELHLDTVRDRMDLWVMRPGDSRPTKVFDDEYLVGLSGTTNQAGTLDINWINDIGGGSGGRMWIDELEIADQYIGPIGGGPGDATAPLPPIGVTAVIK